MDLATQKDFLIKTEEEKPVVNTFGADYEDPVNHVGKCGGCVGTCIIKRQMAEPNRMAFEFESVFEYRCEPKAIPQAQQNCAKSPRNSKRTSN